MTSIDNRMGANFMEMFNPLVDFNSEKYQGLIKRVEEAEQGMIDAGVLKPTEEEIAKNSAEGVIARESLRQKQKDTEVYALYKLDGEVVGMYLKDATVYTMFDDFDVRSEAVIEAKSKGLVFEEYDDFVSNKIEEFLKAEYGDRLEVKTFAYGEPAPFAGEFSDQFFGDDSKYEDLQAMNSKIVMDPSFFAVMTERYQ